VLDTWDVKRSARDPDLVGKLARGVLGIGCAYEILALATGWVPTITQIVKYANRRQATRVLVWVWCGFVAWHFMEPEDFPS